MTKEEALALLQSASRTDKPCSINRNLTESQAVGIIEACVVKVADGGTLHNILEKRVRQMLIPINAKDAKIAELQSTITAQAQQINELKTDADFWFDQACAFMPASTMPKMSIQGQEHTALMNDIEKSTRD